MGLGPCVWRGAVARAATRLGDEKVGPVPRVIRQKNGSNASKPDDPVQHKRFIDMAREVEADETPGATERAFEKLGDSIRSPKPKTSKR